MISRLELDNANDKLEQINDKLDEMYDLIEHEVKAKMKWKKLKNKFKFNKCTRKIHYYENEIDHEVRETKINCERPIKQRFTLNNLKPKLLFKMNTY